MADIYNDELAELREKRNALLEKKNNQYTDLFKRAMDDELGRELIKFIFETTGIEKDLIAKDADAQHIAGQRLVGQVIKNICKKVSVDDTYKLIAELETKKEQSIEFELDKVNTRIHQIRNAKSAKRNKL